MSIQRYRESLGAGLGQTAGLTSILPNIYSNHNSKKKKKKEKAESEGHLLAPQTRIYLGMAPLY